MRISLCAAAVLPLVVFGQGLVNAQPTAPRGLSADPVAIQPLRNTVCQALTPAGWSVIDQDDRGSTYSVASADRRMIASYGVAAISRAQVAGYYGPQFRRPALFAQYLAEVTAGEHIGATASRSFNGMTAIDFQGSTKHGFVLYSSWPNANEPGGYVISARIAIGPNGYDVPIAGAVASSIECNTTFKPPAGGYAQVKAKGAETGISKRCQAGSCDESDLAGTYNAQLGTGYVHSASGENYLVDVASNYRETGPEGPGYYRQVGNNLEKLEPGRSD